uniref:acyl carrier protein n=1 Tax=Burkholderia thailandensis TaxID=57975 RepID=UPI0021555465
VLYGERAAIAAWLATSDAMPPRARAARPMPAARVDLHALRALAASLIGVDAHDINVDADIDEYGLDAVALAHLAREIGERAGRADVGLGFVRGERTLRAIARALDASAPGGDAEVDIGADADADADNAPDAEACVECAGIDARATPPDAGAPQRGAHAAAAEGSARDEAARSIAPLAGRGLAGWRVGAARARRRAPERAARGRAEGARRTAGAGRAVRAIRNRFADRRCAQ